MPATLRFIPAPAGNSHPGCRAQATMDGSSPRLRGTLGVARRVSVRRRFIPAPAGNSREIPATESRKTVHPRACGELRPDSIRDTSATGSSPRLRGTLPDPLDHAGGRRFIPAPAGNSDYIAQPCIGVSGSSPRLRGTQQAPWPAVRRHRLIPAPAGNSQ